MRTAVASGVSLAALPLHALAAGELARVRLGYVGTPCEAITYAAPASALFRRNRLDARVVAFDDEAALVAALGAGTVDAASVNLPALMQPLERGAHVRVAAGLHAGCLRVVAPEEFALRTFGDLKGAAIATDRLHGSSMNLLSAVLRRQGIDPARDVSWHVYGADDFDALSAALAAKSIACVAAADPFAYRLLAAKIAEPYANTAEGGFACGAGIGGGHHCFLALSGHLVETKPSVAAALTRAYVAASRSLATAPGGSALAEVRGGFSDVTVYESIAMLSSYDWSPATDLVLEELELTAHDFRRAGLLRASTDPETLAARAYVDTSHA